MEKRLELQALLEQTIGSKNVYFQPPSTVRMVYPCVRYERDIMDTRFANNRPYQHLPRYQVTLMDTNPDSPLMSKLAELPMCVFDRPYSRDNIYHYVFNIHF